jgi:hypothetical protein
MGGIKKLFKPKMPKIVQAPAQPAAVVPVELPDPEPVAAVPTQASPEVRAERRRVMRERSASQGRDSTNLVPYSNSVLGE